MDIELIIKITTGTLQNESSQIIIILYIQYINKISGLYKEMRSAHNRQSMNAYVMYRT